jgi:hypothetical protein
MQVVKVFEEVFTVKKLLIVCLLVLAILVPATPVLADGPDGDRTVFGGSFTLPSGETLDGSLIVFGGNATLEEDSRVRDNVVLMGGSADIAGQIDGDLVVFGGNAHLRSTAVVDGNVVTVGGKVQRDEGAQVRGEVTEGFGAGYFPRFQFYRSYRWPVEEWPFEGWFVEKAMDAVQAVFFTLVILALGVLVVIFLPRHTNQVARVVLGSPLPSLGVGFAIMVVTAVLAAMLVFTCCFAPFGLLVLLSLVIAVMFGWIAVGLMVGQRILEALNVRQPVSEVVAVLIGLLIITLLTYVPCCLGFLFFVVIASIGLGAVMLTRFGTQEYPPSEFAEASTSEVWVPEELEVEETPVPEPEEEVIEEAPSESEAEESPPEDQGSEAAED